MKHPLHFHLDASLANNLKHALMWLRLELVLLLQEPISHKAHTALPWPSLSYVDWIMCLLINVTYLFSHVLQFDWYNR